MDKQVNIHLQKTLFIMVTKKTLKLFDFNGMDDYYMYVLESRLNGQHKQARELFRELEGNQLTDFWSWLHDNNCIQGMREYFNIK